MPFEELLIFANATINTIEPTSLSDDTLSNLRAIFPEKLVLAALDLIDRGNVIHYATPWGHSEYEVLGSTSTYSILLDLEASRIPYSCSCPAFSFSVLMAGTHIMCKHVLAAMIARKSKLSIERLTGAEDLTNIVLRHFPLPQKGPEEHI